jgi:hypothetical protein
MAALGDELIELGCIDEIIWKETVPGERGSLRHQRTSTAPAAAGGLLHEVQHAGEADLAPAKWRSGR